MRNADREIEALIDKVDQPVEQQHRYVDQRMRLSEIGDDGLKHCAPERDGSGNRQLTARQSRFATPVLLGCVEIANYASRILEKARAWLREVDGPRRSIEEPHTEPLFECGDGARQGRRVRV